MARIKVLWLSFLALLLSNCENPVITDDDRMEPQGNLKVSIYQIEQTPFSALTRAESGIACSRLNFIVYDESGSRLNQVSQKVEEPGFGTTAFQLEEGIYQLVVVGHSASGNPTTTNLSKIQFTNATGYTDTFLYYGEVTVGTEQTDWEVSLHRIVSLCRFVITDDIPSEVKKLRFYYTGGSGAFNAVTGLGSVASKQTVTFDVTPTSSKQFDLYTFLHDLSDNIALTVSALDASGVEILQHQFDVPMQQNHITWLSGEFFTGSTSGSTGITITINTDWAGETHQNF